VLVSGWVVMVMVVGGVEGGRRGGLVDLGVTEVFPSELGLVSQLLLDPLSSLVDLGVTEVFPSELGLVSQLLLDPHQLVVLGQTL